MSDQRIADAKQKLAKLLDKVPQTHAHGASNDPVRSAQADAESAFFHADQIDASDMPADAKARMKAMHAGKAEDALDRLGKAVE